MTAYLRRSLFLEHLVRPEFIDYFSHAGLSDLLPEQK